MIPFEVLNIWNQFDGMICTVDLMITDILALFKELHLHLVNFIFVAQ